MGLDTKLPDGQITLICFNKFRRARKRRRRVSPPGPSKARHVAEDA
jgi:hypothetical protein